MMKRIDTLAVVILANAGRVAEQGSWPSWMSDDQKVTSLFGRVPKEGKIGSGFDAGIACALDLIPREKQTLASVLHAAYTEAAVEQVRREAQLDDANFADSETCWWLAACSVCEQEGVSQAKFKFQVSSFREMVKSPEQRVEAARACYAAMRRDFTVMADGVPFVTRDGGAQGAYIAGYDWAVSWSERWRIFYISTFRPSLGLEAFEWSDHMDGDMPMSGPVHGSAQFVKAATLIELGKVTRAVIGHLGMP